MLNQTSIQKPSKVVRAQSRMSEAVSRLEKAMEGRTEIPSVSPAESSSESKNSDDLPELVALQEENRLLRQENSALKRVHAQVSARLDAAIERLSATIGE